MGTNDTEHYEGWANRETWAVALHINNDRGWQESVHELVRNTLDGIAQDPPSYIDPADLTDVFYANRVGDAIRENVEEVLDALRDGCGDSWDQAFNVITDIGSLWRVDWTELGAAFLDDLSSLDGPEGGGVS